MAQSTNEVLNERETQYGDYRQKCATVTFVLELLAEAPSWEILADDMKVSIIMIVMKLARIVHGNPRHQDSWQDIAGYAELVARRLTSDGVQKLVAEDSQSVPATEPHSEGPSEAGVQTEDSTGEYPGSAISARGAQGLAGR